VVVLWPDRWPVVVWLLKSLFGAPLDCRRRARREEVAPQTLLDTIRIYAVQTLLFVPGAVAGGFVGWLIITPVNWRWEKSFEPSTGSLIERLSFMAKGRLALRLSAIVLLIYVGLIGLTGFGFTRVPTGFHSHPGQGAADRQHPAPRCGLSGTDVRGEAWAVEKIALELPEWPTPWATQAARSCSTPLAQT